MYCFRGLCRTHHRQWRVSVYNNNFYVSVFFAVKVKMRLIYLNGYTKMCHANLVSSIFYFFFFLEKAANNKKEQRTKGFFFNKIFITFCPALPLHIISSRPPVTSSPLPSFLFTTDLSTSSCAPLPVNPYRVMFFFVFFFPFQPFFRLALVAVFKPAGGNVEILYTVHYEKILNLSGVKFRLTRGQAHLLYISLIL